MLIRYFAGAAEAAGRDQHSIDLVAGTTVAHLIEDLSAANPQLGRVLAVSALLLDSRRCADHDQLLDDVAQLDVLPPFAGG